MIAKQPAFRLVCGFGCWLMVTCLAMITAGQETAGQEITRDTNSILVTRDLTVISPVVIETINPDGVLLNDGQCIAWYDILVARQWQNNSEQLASELSDETVQRYLNVYGQDWFFILNRLRRGEVLEVTARLQSLRDRYAQVKQVLVGQAAVELLLSQQYAAQGERAAAATAWFYWQEHYQSFKSSPDWKPVIEPWLEHYVDLTQVEAEPSLGIPNYLAPFNLEVDETRLAQWRSCQQVPQTAVFELVAAIETGDFLRIVAAEQRLQTTLPLWNETQRPVIRHILKTLEGLKRWQGDSELSKNDEMRLGYLDLEQQWLESFAATEPPEPAAATTREQIVWQLYLEGLYLLAHPDQRLAPSGMLRWMLLKHWSLEYPMIALKNPVLGPELHRAIARRTSASRQ